VNYQLKGLHVNFPPQNYLHLKYMLPGITSLNI